MKRFYKTVSVVSTEGGYQCKLDDKDVKTPMRKLLVLPNEQLAKEVAKEWNAQAENINPHRMPLTQILTTSRDKVEGRRESVESALCRYMNTDMILYFAEDVGITSQVAQRQESLWRPWITWFEKKSGKPLKTTTALTVLEQEKAHHDYMKNYVTELSDLELTVFQILASETSSLILAMGFMEGKLDAKHLLETANAEEFFKNEIYNFDFYGRDPMQDKKWKAARAVFDACQICLDNR